MRRVVIESPYAGDFFKWYRARMHNPIAQIALKDKERKSC